MDDERCRPPPAAAAAASRRIASLRKAIYRRHATRAMYGRPVGGVAVRAFHVIVDGHATAYPTDENRVVCRRGGWPSTRARDVSRAVYRSVIWREMMVTLLSDDERTILWLKTQKEPDYVMLTTFVVQFKLKIDENVRSASAAVVVIRRICANPHCSNHPSTICSVNII